MSDDDVKETKIELNNSFKIIPVLNYRQDRLISVKQI